MAESPGSIDEAARRRFEQDRRAGGDTPIESFLPPPGDPSRSATLEELVCIDLEFAIKRDASTVPSIAELVARFPELADPEVEARLAAEVETIRDSRSPASASGLTMAAPQSGDRIGRYELDRPVGSGAFAQVWRARDTELHRTVAIKITRPDIASNPEARARVHREARSAAQLRHPGIVPVYDVVEWHGCPCIVSEFVAGDTMALRLARARPDADTAARWIAELAEALHYAHQCGVVHRDVKPGNVMMSESGRPMLTDFGLAQLADAEMTLTQQGDVLGTPAYLSPEQARGQQAEVDARSDVFSLGVMLYEGLTGSRPFDSATTASLLYSVIHEEPPTPRSRAAEVPLDLETICLAAIAKERDRRLPSAAELAADLRRYLAREPIHARRLSPLARAVLWTRRNPALAATIAVSVTVVALVGIIGYVNVLDELYGSRVGQIGSLIRARDSDWHGKAQRVLADAAAMGARDERELRDLALGIHTSRHSWFECRRTWRLERARRVAISTDQEFVAIVAADGRIQVSATTSDAPGPVRQFAKRASIAFARDGQSLIVGSKDTIFVWRFRGGGEPREIKIGGGVIHTLAAGRDVAYVSGADGVIRIVSLEAGSTAEMRTMDGHDGGTYTLALSPDGKVLASGGEDNKLLVHDLETLSVIATGRSPNQVRSVAFDANATRVTWSAWETYGYGVFDFREATEPVALSVSGTVHDDAVRSVVAASGVRQLTASADGTVRAWQPGYQQFAIARAESGSILHAAGVPGSDHLVACYADGTVRMWELRESPYRGIVQSTNCLRFAPGSSRFFTGAGSLTVADSDGIELSSRTYPGFHEEQRDHGPTWGLGVSPDGRWLVTAAHDGHVAIRDAVTLSVKHGVQTGWDTGWSVAFRQDSKECTVGFEQGMITFDPNTGKELRRFEGHERLVVSVAYHPRSPVLVSAAYDWTIRLWDTRTGQPLGVLARESAPWHEMVITRDGRYLAVACGDGTVRVWDLQADRLAQTFAAEPARLSEELPARHVLEDQNSAVWSLTLTADGRHLAAGTQNGRVAIYEVDGFAHVTTFAAGLRMVRALSFSADGRWLAAGCFGAQSMVLDYAGLRRELRQLGLDW